MHPVLFSLKHAYLASLAKQRKWLREFGITPARYEMLVVIARTNAWLKKEHFVHQSAIWRELGVSAVTVSKMLKALETFGFVRRTPSLGWDRRQVIVELTRKARGLLRRVMDVWIKPGYVWLALYTAFAPGPNSMGVLDSTLYSIRKHFHDRATFLYSWFFPSKRRQLALTGRAS